MRRGNEVAAIRMRRGGEEVGEKLVLEARQKMKEEGGDDSSYVGRDSTDERSRRGSAGSPVS